MVIRKSANADSRSAKIGPSIEDLHNDTKSHISDVSQGLDFIAEKISARGPLHDHTKIDMMKEFHAALQSGHIKETEWYQKHITQERHHLLSHVPENVTLVDVIEHLVDCTMAGLARSGTVYDVDLPDDILQLAVRNTVEMIKKNTQVIDADTDLLDSPIEETL